MAILFFYNKGQERTISRDITLAPPIILTLDKEYIKSKDQSTNYIVFSAQAKNTTAKKFDYYDYQKSKNFTNNSYRSNSSTPTLRTSKNQSCPINTYYTISAGTQNIGAMITSDYLPSENKIGHLIYECSKSATGGFIMNYEDKDYNIN